MRVGTSHCEQQEAQAPRRSCRNPAEPPRGSHQEKPQEGTILAVGPGEILEDGTRKKMDVKEGDRVLYSKYAGTEFKVDGDDLLIIASKDILAIVEG